MEYINVRVTTFAMLLVFVGEVACSESQSGTSSSNDGSLSSGGGGQAGESGGGTQSSTGGTQTSADASSGGTGGSSGTSSSGSGGVSGADAGTSTGGGSEAGTDGGGTGANYLPCTDSTPFLVEGQDTGFEQCADGSVLHRARVVECPNLLPRTNIACAAIGTVTEPCAVDSDCTAAQLGFCTPVPTSHYPGCGCVYGCVQDLDCAPGEICECGDPVGVCRPASCTADADCPGESRCASASLGWGGCSWTPPERGYECQTSSDTCLTDADCVAPTPACAFDAQTGTRACHEGQLACP